MRVGSPVFKRVAKLITVLVGALTLAVIGTTAGQASSPELRPTRARIPAQPAAAARTDLTQTFQNRYTHRCLDDSTGKTGYGLRTVRCQSKNKHQQWSVHVWNDGTRELHNVSTGRCMYDSYGGFGARTPCDKSTSQSWYVTHLSAGYIVLQNQSTHRCLDDSDKLRTYVCQSNNDHQQWS